MTVIMFPHVVTPPAQAVETEALVSFWRHPDNDALMAGLSDPEFLRGLGEAARRVRPLARAVSWALDAAETSVAIGAVLGEPLVHGRETFATDLLATALMLDGLADDPTARLGVDRLRRQRGLAVLNWLALSRRPSHAARKLYAGESTEPSLRP